MMSSTAPVTVIIPTYNRGALIAQSIDSILAQTLSPEEILIIVDGSTDNTLAELARFGDRIRVISKENGGKSTALNLGLSMATKPLVWIFDDDDIACPDALLQLHTALSGNPQAGLAYGMLDRFFGDWPAPVSDPWPCYQSGDRKALYIRLMQDFFIWQGAMLVRKACYDEIGVFDERFTRSQDYEMLLRLIRKFEAVAVPEVVFHQRHHAGERGPAHARFSSASTDRVWAGFNHLIFDEIYLSHRLEEFCCRSDDGPLDVRSTLTALLQRALIMARKGVWTRATADIEEAAGIAARIPGVELNRQEITALRAVFEHGARSHFRSLREALAFSGAVQKFGPKLAAEILGNLMLPVSHRSRLWLRRPDKFQEATQLFYLTAALVRPASLPRYMAARRSEYRLFNVEAMTAATQQTKPPPLSLRSSGGPPLQNPI